MVFGDSTNLPVNSGLRLCLSHFALRNVFECQSSSSSFNWIGQSLWYWQEKVLVVRQVSKRVANKLFYFLEFCWEHLVAVLGWERALSPHIPTNLRVGKRSWMYQWWMSEELIIGWLHCSQGLTVCLINSLRTMLAKLHDFQRYRRSVLNTNKGPLHKTPHWGFFRPFLK